MAFGMQFACAGGADVSPPCKLSFLTGLMISMLLMSLGGCEQSDVSDSRESTQPPAGYTPASPSGESVLIAFIEHKWHTSTPSEEFLLKGEKPSTDRQLGTSIGFREKDPWYVLGEGLIVRDYPGLRPGGGAGFYRDKNETRLIALEGPHFATDMIILSAESKHAARLVEEDLAALRTETGIGLGDSKERLVSLLGEPSARDSFGEYEIFWFLEKPRHETAGGPGTPAFEEGCAAAYALKKDKVVEIWLHLWSTERSG